MANTALFHSRRDYANIAQPAQRALHRRQPGGVDAVIVG
jgi:hypothetical protein